MKKFAQRFTFIGTVVFVLWMSESGRGASLLVWFRSWFPQEMSFLTMGLYAVLAFVGYQASVVVHLVGAVVAGHARGFKFHYLSLWGLWMSRGAKSISVRRRRQCMPAGGSCFSSPAPNATRGDLLWYLSGAPIASAALTCLGIGVVWYLGPQSEDPHAGVRFTAAAVAVSSALMLTIWLLDLVLSDGLEGDGARIRRLWNDDSLVASEIAQKRMFGFLCAGIRPREWPEQMVSEIDASGTASDKWLAKSTQAAIQFDLGNHREALAISSELMADADSMPEDEGALYASAHAFLVAYVDRDGQEARKWFEKARGSLQEQSRGGLVESHRLLCLQAAVQHAEGDMKRALESLDDAQAAWKDAFVPITDADRELMHDLRAKLHNP